MMPRPSSTPPAAPASTYTIKRRKQQQPLAAAATITATLAAAFALLTLLPGGASAHAVLLDPPSRPWMDYLLNYNYNPHAVFAGGMAAVSKGETLTWPAAHKSGVCGDAAGETKWSTPGPIRKTYKSGQTFDADVLFAQNHLGRWQLRVCPLDARDESACRDLVRADGKGRSVDLVWTKDWHGVTSGFEPPLGIEGFSIYKMPPVGKNEGCAAWACDQFKGMYVYRSKWRLPQGFTCKHCALQMFYLTASRCWPRCLPDSVGCKPKPVNYPYCGDKGASYPEEFWNCADISIV